METARSSGIGSVVHTTILLLANLTVMMVVSISVATHYETSETANSATPFSDGVIDTMVVVVVLVLVNGAILCLTPGTRRIGAGAVIAALASVPVGFVVLLYSLASVLGDS